MANMPQYHLLERVGIEIEYMIVDTQTLTVKPIADRLIRDSTSSRTFVSDAERGPITWSNELVAHVIEMKTTDPVSPHDIPTLAHVFAKNVRDANKLLTPLRACLLPTAMHPWMNPETETKLWPHEGAEIYATFDRLFNCRRHGWANLQSMHLNISFSGDEEFARLHAAVRLLLPILPALAASSPIMDRQLTGKLDNRLEVYRTNSSATTTFAGRIIPEPVFGEAEYQETILQPIAAEIQQLGAEDVLEPEFTNSRGAIARFKRGSLEIRLLDTQECPSADLAVGETVVKVLRAILDETWSSLADQKAWPIERLETILLDCIQDADKATIRDPHYLKAFGIQNPAEPILAHQLWKHLIGSISLSTQAQPFANHYHEYGTLARRIANAASQNLTQAAIYQELANCLETNTHFSPSTAPYSP